MKTITGRVLATAVVLVASLIAASAAHAAARDGHLLAMHQPVLVFDRSEAFRPTIVESFLADADLEHLDGTAWTVSDANPTAAELPETGASTWRLNQDTCTPAAPLGGLACYAAAANDGNDPSVVYARVARPAGAIVLQYWLFYYDNTYSYAYPPSNLIWQAHEGDWEVVNVVLSSGGDPVSTGYSQHCSGQRRSWSATPRFGEHPIVHVAAGSHANYFAAGVHPINPTCIPRAAVAFLLGAGLPLPFDWALDGGGVAGPSSAGGTLSTIQRVDRSAGAGWLAFPAPWGELEYFHAPTPIGTLPFGTAPLGPAFHSVWRDPLGTIGGWPVG